MAAGQLPHEETFAAEVMLPRGQQIIDFSAVKSVDVVLQPGEVSFHHVHTPHASGPNRSDDYRIGCSMVFIPPWVHHREVRESAMRVRGRDPHGHFDEEPRPNADLDPAARAAHQAAMTKMGTYQAEKRLSNSRRG